MAENHVPGSCLCGGVRFEVRGPMQDITACHCTQCRKTTGHFLASTNVANDDLVMTENGGLRWYKSSDVAERGFCGTCGATLFWRGFGRSYISISAGALEKPTGLKIAKNIFVADKGDYYAIPDHE
jgi:hypothetical protein